MVTENSFDADSDTTSVNTEDSSSLITSDTDNSAEVTFSMFVKWWEDSITVSYTYEQDPTCDNNDNSNEVDLCEEVEPTVSVMYWPEDAPVVVTPETTDDERFTVAVEVTSEEDAEFETGIITVTFNENSQTNVAATLMLEDAFFVWEAQYEDWGNGLETDPERFDSVQRDVPPVVNEEWDEASFGLYTTTGIDQFTIAYTTEWVECEEVDDEEEVDTTPETPVRSWSGRSSSVSWWGSTPSALLVTWDDDDSEDEMTTSNSNSETNSDGQTSELDVDEGEITSILSELLWQVDTTKLEACSEESDYIAMRYNMLMARDMMTTTVVPSRFRSMVWARIMNQVMRFIEDLDEYEDKDDIIRRVVCNIAAVKVAMNMKRENTWAMMPWATGYQYIMQYIEDRVIMKLDM